MGRKNKIRASIAVAKAVLNKKTLLSSSNNIICLTRKRLMKTYGCGVVDYTPLERGQSEEKTKEIDIFGGWLERQITNVEILKKEVGERNGGKIDNIEK